MAVAARGDEGDRVRAVEDRLGAIGIRIHRIDRQQGQAALGLAVREAGGGGRHADRDPRHGTRL